MRRNNTIRKDTLCFEAPKEARALSSLVLICGTLTTFLGLTALLGWAAGLPVLTSYIPGRIPMAPNTALLFLLYGAGTVFVSHSSFSRSVCRLGAVIGSASALLSLLLFLLSSLGIHPEAEHLGFRITGTIKGAPIGHMSPLTAFCFLLAGLSFIALLSSSPSRPWRTKAASVLAFLIILTSFILLMAYLLGLPLLYGTTIIPPALSTSMAFMVLGASLLASAVQHAISHVKQYDISTSWASYVFAVIFVFMATGIIATGYLYYRNYEKNHRAGVEHQLSAVADMKVDELVSWRKERVGDAGLFYKNANFSGLVRRYLQNPDDAEAKERLRTWLRHVHEGHPYDRLFLLDAGGRERIWVPEERRPVALHAMRRAIEFQRMKQVVFEDFHRNENDGRVYLSVLVPILDKQDSAVGTLVMRIDPELNLYPFIKRWPAPSLTAETLIVRRDGNDALFLNELRFLKATALNLRIPLEQKETPAVQAVLGQEGIMEGKDYRGVPVISAIRTVPDSPWFLVARMDVSEVYAPVRERRWVMFALVIALLIGAAGGVGLVWRQQKVVYYRKQYLASEELRESEERYHRALDNMLEGCQIIEPDWRYRYVNDAAVQHGRRSKDEFLDHTIQALYPGIENTILFGELRRTMDDRIARSLENEFVYPDGARAWFELSIQPAPEGIFILSMDITERKRAEKERETTIEFLRLVNESTVTGDLVRSAASFFQQQSGCEAVGVRLREGDDYPYYEAHGFPEEFVHAESSLCVKDKTGSVARDDTGYPRLECMCGNVISGRFNPEKPFFTSRGSFWTNCTTELLATTTEADRQARTRNRCNGEGYESVALIALRIGEQRLGLLQLNDRRKNVFSPEAIAVWERLADHLAVALAKFRSEEELKQHREHLEELVEQRTIELKSVNRELEAFSYSVSHDLKTPLRAIDGFSNVMLEEYAGKLDGEGRRILNIIRSSAQQMSQLISDLLAFSRISRQQITATYIDMNALIRNVLEELGPFLSGRSVELKVQPLPPARGDRAMVHQALLNLLLNAAKFTLPREEAIIEVGSTVKDNETVYYVKDNGVGFDMRYADKLFGVFQRLHGPDEFEGTGVGLAIVQRVIHRQGGEVWAEGKVNEGAAFYFSLPAAGEGVTGKQHGAADTNKNPIRGGA